MQNTSICVRRAKSEDYEPILDINRDVYEGFDYLPASFHTLLHNPDVHMFVTEREGKIVSNCFNEEFTCIMIGICI